MEELFRKLEKSFLIIDPELSIQKAFELLADPHVNILVYFGPDNKEFYYLTEREIIRSIEKKSGTNGQTVKDAAIRSLVFNYELFIDNNIEYLKQFNESMLKQDDEIQDLFFVINKGNQLGLVSDLVLKNLPVVEESGFNSGLDKFIKSEPEPLKEIDKFFVKVLSFGFNLNPEVKAHIREVLEKRIEEYKRRDSTYKTKTKEPIEDESLKVEARLKDATEVSTKVIVTYNPGHINHRPNISSPETPERLIKIMELLKGREKVFNKKCRLVSDYPPGSEEDLLRVHIKPYIQFVKDYASKGGGFLGDSTYITQQSHDLALLAIGGAIKAAEEVLAQNAEFGFGLIRPPGHHASRDKYGGYCIYNNAAVLARYLQRKKGIEKVLIIDWDAHAANGTMDIFYEDPTVMLISMHQDPHNFYPKTGFLSQMGKSNGIGTTVNVEMPRGSGDEEYLTVFKKLVIPLYRSFEPGFVICCNGFDSHHSDHYTDLNLTADGYYEFCSMLRKYLKNKMVILMEGGYNPYLGELTHTIINALMDLPIPFEDKFSSLAHKVISDEKVHLLLNNNIVELQKNLGRHHIL